MFSLPPVPPFPAVACALLYFPRASMRLLTFRRPPPLIRIRGDSRRASRWKRRERKFPFSLSIRAASTGTRQALSIPRSVASSYSQGLCAAMPVQLLRTLLGNTATDPPLTILIPFHGIQFSTASSVNSAPNNPLYTLHAPTATNNNPRIPRDRCSKAKNRSERKSKPSNSPRDPVQGIIQLVILGAPWIGAALVKVCSGVIQPLGIEMCSRLSYSGRIEQRDSYRGVAFARSDHRARPSLERGAVGKRVLPPFARSLVSRSSRPRRRLYVALRRRPRWRREECSRFVPRPSLLRSSRDGSTRYQELFRRNGEPNVTRGRAADNADPLPPRTEHPCPGMSLPCRASRPRLYCYRGMHRCDVFLFYGGVQASVRCSPCSTFVRRPPGRVLDSHCGPVIWVMAGRAWRWLLFHQNRFDGGGEFDCKGDEWLAGPAWIVRSIPHSGNWKAFYYFFIHCLRATVF